MPALVVAQSKRSWENAELQTGPEAASTLLQKPSVPGVQNLVSFAILPLVAGKIAAKKPLPISGSVILDSRERRTHQKAIRA